MSEELTPMNHRELWLQAIATGTVPEWLEPMTHEELWLKTIAQGGGSGGGGVLAVTDTAGKLDKTWQEIHDAMLAGGAVVIFSETDVGSILESRYSNNANQYIIKARAPGGTFVDYIGTSASGYPAVVSAGGGGND